MAKNLHYGVWYVKCNLPLYLGIFDFTGPSLRFRIWRILPRDYAFVAPDTRSS
jgi:hypothetical protein